jgi:hypothetical protein
MTDTPAETTAAPAPAQEAVMVLPRPSLFEELAAKRMSLKLKGLRHGIDRAMLGDYMKLDGPAPEDALEGLTEEVAKDILYRRYWLPLGGDKLPHDVMRMVWDVAIVRGVTAAVKLVQQSIGDVVPVALKVDGYLGRETKSAIDHLIKEGKSIALAEQIVRRRTSLASIAFSLLRGDRKRLDLPGALLLVARTAIKAQTGVSL